jgi:hypothetical protein
MSTPLLIIIPHSSETGEKWWPNDAVIHLFVDLKEAYDTVRVKLFAIFS